MAALFDLAQDIVAYTICRDHCAAKYGIIRGMRDNILHVERMTGSNIQQGAVHSQITATHTITTQQFVESVRKLVRQVERALPTSDLPTEVQEQTKAILAELT